MRPETQDYWDKTLTGLVNAIGPEHAKTVAMETSRRMGAGGSTRQWTVMLLKVLAEWARANGVDGSVVDLIAAVRKDTERR